ncbi:hypothetical protein COY05_00335 [Candidatus Peregrinibacteria bacterium CG_4_10_14_0_2_um_filter_38_24]|nr:MAG: hypothetical protein COY05_00335 [Candidatus Peregrinibacteria bacterium CG_4_10_14_0_2_um_filter_38_24]PJC38858.1 MAG: hypothetical protein CO044_02745 [Candidatus Peregrinibacteria bacterium CG_4_9_14_0_2_um_filter_38_9]
MKKIFAIVLLSFLAQFAFGFSASARDNVDYWYIKDFQSEIVVNKDSSLLITEKITADCGSCFNKHGIFRILPTETNTTAGTFKRPVELISITDFDGNSLQYDETNDSGTVTWKIGNPDVTVQGLNYYKIVYKVQNAVYFGGENFDELYWNLNGNFWDMETDNFSADIVFPEEVNEGNSALNYFTGEFDSVSKDLAEYTWVDDNTLRFYSVGTLGLGDGITVSAMFPKNIFTPYQFTFFELYGEYFWWIIPFIVFIFCFIMWKKHGDDPENDKSIMPEFGSPEDLTPMQMGVLMDDGAFDNKFITASLINLAVHGFIYIKEIESKVLLVFTSKDYEISSLKEDIHVGKGISEADVIVYRNLFEVGAVVSLFSMIAGGIFIDKKNKIYPHPVTGFTVKLSDLKNHFYKALEPIKKQVLKELHEKDLLEKHGLMFKSAFFTVAVLLYFVLVLLLTLDFFDAFSLFAIFLSALIFFLFSFIMPKKTVKGVELERRIKGFKMYMKTAEKYRQKFYEEENIFERFLPYAIVFGITSLWAKKMVSLYGEKYFYSHYPIWFSSSSGSFDLGDFSTNMTSLADSISSNVSSPSGGSGGGSGGGGGGGGGGGW